ncbi:MAG: DUF2312 domain-containing protein [Paracoccaceae bacterium]|jgi:uncharacterized protein (UPF0335 family)|nr:DUF2312 domain-containing protein [Paracoccaceae bacterium]MDE2694465.1 DUF2312 domain-containing protein [Paracoccaceae bacterium]|tara:strand:- start:96 stop:353 length:258 start_codon:yes stop_codon:yes gene_type:complete
MDETVNDSVYRVTRDEIRSFVERIERLNIEKSEIAEQQNEVFAEAKSRGYDTRILRKVVSMRKQDPQDLSEQEAILEIYREALDL